MKDDKKPFSTEKQIRAHFVPDGKSKDRHAVTNRGFGGLAIEARQGRATMAWVYRYRIAGHLREMSLGSYPAMTLAEARAAHADAAKLVVKGIDPRKQRRAEKALNEQQWTVGELFDLWIEHYASTPSERRKTIPIPRTIMKQRGRWNVHLSKHLGSLYVRDVSRGAIVPVLEQAARKGREEARQCLTLLRMMFDYAETREQIDANPTEGLSPHKIGATPPKPRERHLSIAELSTLWKELDGMKLALPISRAIKLLILTGSRRGEVAEMQWKEISGNTWTIPAARTKSRRAHDVHLSPLAQSIIEEQRELSGGGFVFESMNKPGNPITRDAITRAITRLQGRGTKDHNTTAPLYALEHFTVHDLRRSAATTWTETLGADPLLVEGMLDHLPPKLLGTYNKAKRYPAQVAIWDRWGDFITEILKGQIKTAENVVFLKKI